VIHIDESLLDDVGQMVRRRDEMEEVAEEVEAIRAGKFVEDSLELVLIIVCTEEALLYSFILTVPVYRRHETPVRVDSLSRVMSLGRMMSLSEATSLNRVMSLSRVMLQ